MSDQDLEPPVSLPKYRGRCFDEQAGRACKNAEKCPWLHHTQIDAS